MYFPLSKYIFVVNALSMYCLLIGAAAVEVTTKTTHQMKVVQSGVPIFDVTTKQGRAQFADPVAVRNELKAYGFQSVQFDTQDGVKLSGLMLVRPNAKRNVVMCAGFFPGFKEGMASFLHLFPEDTNFLLFDARGHGQSEGRFWTHAGNYGLREYRDVIAAIKYLHNAAPLDTYVFAYCMGCLHATHALIKLSEQNELARYNIRGFISSSGASSLQSLKDVLSKHVIDITLPKILGYSPAQAYKSASMPLLKLYSSLALYAVQYGLFMPGVYWNHHAVRLEDKIHVIQCPILFIHSQCDDYICSAGTQELFQQAKKAGRTVTLHLLEGESNHFSHYLEDKWKKVYMDTMAEFMNKHVSHA